MTDKREAIFDATLALVSERGFHGTPTSAIARDAGVGVGTIYRYFDNKEALIDALYKRLRQQLSQALLTDYSTDLPLRERFRRIWINTVRYGIDHPLEISFMEQYAHSPFLKEESIASRAEHLRPVSEFVEDGVYEGVLKDLSLELFNSLTLEVAISLARKHREGIIVLHEVTLERAVDACWDAAKR